MIQPVETYDFIGACDLMWRRILAETAELPAPKGRPVGILITPWLQTAVPFVSLEIALFLRRQGRAVKVLLDCRNLEINSSSWFEQECDALRHLLKQVENIFPCIDVEQSGAGLEELSRSWVEFNYLENSIRKEKGEVAGARFYETHSIEVAKALEHSRRILSVLRRLQADWVLIPGGFFGLSGLYVESCARLKISFSTYDSGPGDLRVCHNGLAAQNAHIPELFALLPKNKNLAARMWKKAEETVHWRREGNDPFRLQPKDARPFAGKGHLVLCLNFRADTAAMMRQLCFPMVSGWIRATAAWAVRHQVPLYVRQHPCERIEKYRSSDDFGTLLKEMDAAGEWLHFVSCHDDINTYDLIQDAAAVLPYTSRTGIEAAFLGKPVILHSLSFYRGLGFTFDAKTPDEYHALLQDAVAGKLEVSLGMREKAAACYSLLSDYSRIPTDFTPVPEDFSKWSATLPVELWRQPELVSLARSLVSRKPFALCYFSDLRQKGWLADLFS